MNYESFCTKLFEGNTLFSYEYNENTEINIWTKNTGFFVKKKIWVFDVHILNDSFRYMLSYYSDPNLLLQNARIDGKSLKEIWDDLKE